MVANLGLWTILLLISLIQWTLTNRKTSSYHKKRVVNNLGEVWPLRKWLYHPRLDPRESQAKHAVGSECHWCEVCGHKEKVETLSVKKLSELNSASPRKLTAKRLSLSAQYVGSADRWYSASSLREQSSRVGHSKGGWTHVCSNASCSWCTNQVQIQQGIGTPPEASQTTLCLAGKPAMKEGRVQHQWTDVHTVCYNCKLFGLFLKEGPFYRKTSGKWSTKVRCISLVK